MTERIMRETKEIIERPFSTSPKIRRHKKHCISLTRLKRFMHHLFKQHLTECSYDTLQYEFIQHFGTNEPRVIARYIGKAEKIVRYPGADVVRIKDQSTVAQFHYTNTRRVKAEKGLIEILGYATQEVKGRYTLHHELFSYSYAQETLPTLSQEGDYDSIQTNNVCVHPHGLSEHHIAVSVMDAPSKGHVSSDERKEEEDIDNTHICRHIRYASKHNPIGSKSVYWYLHQNAKGAE